MITKDLLADVYAIVRDAKANRKNEVLREFYRAYFNEILMNFDFCMSKCYDVVKKKSSIVISEVIEFILQILQKDKKAENQKLRECILTIESYNTLFQML